jgi:hypothetical protein
MKKKVLLALTLSIGIIFSLSGASNAIVTAQADPNVNRSETTNDAENAAQSEATLHFFEDKLCKICAQQKAFMGTLESDYENLTIITYDISETDRFRELADRRDIEDYRIMAPSTFIGDDLLQFSSFGEREEQILRDAIEGNEIAEDNTIKLPILNKEIRTDTISLPLLAVILGALDGFNVCSLGALILMLTIVLTFDSRKKIFFFGGLFILTTVIVYGSLVFIWGQLIDVFIGQLSILRLLVGLSALGGSAWFFREFWRFYKYGPTCETSSSKIAQATTTRLLKAFEEPGKGSLMLGSSIVLFAAAITIVELPCSIGIPIAFTGILIENGVSLGAYASYIFIYLFFYMLDEVIIFVGAVLTKEIWFAGSKIITWTTLVGAVVLLLLGLYYLLAL